MRLPDSATVRLGVLTNPGAFHNSRFPFTHRNIRSRLASDHDAVVTIDSNDAARAVKYLIEDRGVNVLGINGGDGTIHSVINALVRAYGDEIQAGRLVLPPILLLNGGTYNMASRAMRTNHYPLDTTGRFLGRYEGCSVSEIATRRLGLLRVTPEGDSPVLGMVFGSQVIASVLDLCDQMGGGYAGLAKLLVLGGAGYFLKTKFFKENRWRLTATDREAIVDGRGVRGVTGIVASTIDMKLVRGLIWALTASTADDGFHIKVIRSQTGSDVVRLLPYLLWELPHPMIQAWPQAGRLETSGDYTLDGELYSHKGRITVDLSPFSLRMVSGEDI